MTETNRKSPKKARSVWYRIGRILLFTYLTLLVAIVFFESRLVYPGAYRDTGSVEADGLDPPIENFSYRAEDETDLTGRLIRDESLGSDSQRFIVYFHGNGTKAAWTDHFIRDLSTATRATVLAAEYRGYRDEGPHPSEAGLVLDANAAVDAMCQEFSISSSQLVLYGSSLGGGCVAAVAQSRPVQAIVLERTFDRLVDVAAGIYWFLPVKLLMQNRFDSIERLSNYQDPLFQIHGDVDSLVPIDHARRLYQSIPSTKKYFVEVTGLGHNDHLPRELLTELGTWLDEQDELENKMN